jgi:hypothetical protein
MKDNKLIAKFMGIKIEKSWRDGLDYADKYVWNLNDEQYDCSKPEYLGFHISWDWLMPVVKKIESLGYFVKISTKMSSISRDNKGNNDSYLIKAQFGDKSKLEKTYICVVEAIKYINYLKNKN